MQIVLHNLIDNALKHGNSKKMTLRCHARMLGSAEVEVTVSDNGRGFKNPGKLFLETGEFLVDSGYGLLAIRKLILARGGKITAFNEPETGGSAVIFTLPSQSVTLADGAKRFSNREKTAMIPSGRAHPDAGM